MNYSLNLHISRWCYNSTAHQTQYSKVLYN